MATAEGPSISIRKSGAIDLNKLVEIVPADTGRRLHDLSESILKGMLQFLGECR